MITRITFEQHDASSEPWIEWMKRHDIPYETIPVPGGWIEWRENTREVAWLGYETTEDGKFFLRDGDLAISEHTKPMENGDPFNGDLAAALIAAHAHQTGPCRLLHER